LPNPMTTVEFIEYLDYSKALYPVNPYLKV